VKAEPRPHAAPRVVIGCWAASLAVGALLLAVGPNAPAREPTELGPYSLAAYLERVVGPDARDVRVNSFYGSGHSGGWQFVAHVTWLDTGGVVRGGTTSLPQLAGSEPLVSEADSGRLVKEQQIGWTLDDVDNVLDRLDHLDARFALLELEIPESGRGDLVFCRAESSDGQCEARSRAGQRTRQFADRLSDEPLLGALAVQRASHRVQN
jgi:hypothetical protein